jgi:hypothetical protein
MTFILRWPSVLVLLALVLLCILGAVGAAGVLTGVNAPSVGLEQVDAQVAEAQIAAETNAASATWIDVGLLGGAALFFLIAAVRLMRRTQGFWVWLVGFALYGGRWAYNQSDGLLPTIQGIDPNAYLAPQALLADLGAPTAQVGILAIVLIVGLFIFIVDAADRAYWDKQGA